MKYLVFGLKYLPKNLQNFEISFKDNYLVKNIEFLLEDSQKWIPNRLQSLKFDLNHVNLGENSGNMKLLGESLKNLP